MNIAVCEDNDIDREVICSYIREYCAKSCYDIQIHTFDSGEGLLSSLSKESFQVVFLDIYLTGITGMEAAQKIRETGSDCAIVFITTSVDYALDGYDVSAVSYIVKPVDAKKMEKAFAMCKRLFEESSRYIEVMADYQKTKVAVNKVLYAEVYGKSTLLHYDTKVLKTYVPISKMEEMLGGAPFLRCHRCFLVNVNHVEDIRAQDFLMANGDVVPIRKNGRSEVKLEAASFMCTK